MGKFILVTGGARSGKSSFAESLAGGCGSNVLYIATSIPFDDEMKLRIQKHRKQRPDTWDTLESFKDFENIPHDLVKEKDAILLDCVTIMVSNIMFETKQDWDRFHAHELIDIEKSVEQEISGLLNFIKSIDIPFIAVTNETGMGIVPENPLSRAFRDIAGRTNQQLAKSADEVYFCVSGIPMKIK